jgi:CHASE2 domain-containing sensor protein/signal transduction histidine kinase
MKLKLRLAVEWLLIGLLTTALVVLAIYWRGAASFDNLIYDSLSAATPAPADDNILLVNIDDASLSAVGRWPWPRSIHADLLTKLQMAGSRSITLDLLLSEASGDDASLADAMRGPAPVFVPLHFVSPGSDGRAYDSKLPVEPLTQAAAGVGQVNVAFDSDGIVRRGALCFQVDDGGPKWPHLMELVYRNGKGKPSPAFTRSRCGSELLIPYARRNGFREISYVDLLQGSLPAEAIRGRDVIVGATATGLNDNYPVPNGDGGLLSGTEIMANMLGALRRDDFVEPIATGWIVAFSLLPLWLLLFGFIWWRPRSALIFSLGAVAVVLLGSGVLLSYRIWLPPGSALLGILMVYPMWGWRRLQAMSDFLGSELGALEKEGGAAALPIKPSATNDWVGRQSEALAGAIDQMRDLRRFVSDTLADLPDPMFVTTPEGGVTLTNRLLDERLGRSILGLSMDRALDEMVVADQRHAVDSYVAHSAAADKQNRQFVRFRSPAGRTFVMRRSDVRSDSGELHGHIHYLTDISALAQAEAEREEVLQLLSHDMRAPQSTIIALLNGDITADAKKRIERNARRTMQLAQDFVEIARMAEREFVGEDVLLADLVREAADSLWPLAHERGIKFSFGDSSNGAFVLAEPDSLSRAVCNLVDNAIKFSPNNGIIDIAIARSSNDGNITVTITDQGEGITPDIMPHLFTRFTTGGEQQGRAKGTGLGLTFLRAVIERHGGSIIAQNNAAGGASFIFALPEAPEA